MANKTIAQLVLKTPLLVTDEIEVQATAGGASNKGTLQDVIDLAAASSGTLGLVQISDGAGGFDSDAGLSYGSGVLTVDTSVNVPVVNGDTLTLNGATGLIKLNVVTDQLEMRPGNAAYFKINNDGSFDMEMPAPGFAGFSGDADGNIFLDNATISIQFAKTLMPLGAPTYSAPAIVFGVPDTLDAVAYLQITSVFDAEYGLVPIDASVWDLGDTFNPFRTGYFGTSVISPQVSFTPITEAVRDALTPNKGDVIYNDDTDKLQCCTNATGPVWTNLF